MSHPSDPRETDARDDALWDARERAADDPRGRDLDPRDVFREGLDLPRGRERERVFVDDDTYALRGSEVRTLATIGAFRVVPVDDLRDDRGRPGDLWHGDLDRLRSANLIRAVAPFDRDDERRTVLVTLTDRGRELLDTHRTPDHEPRLQFYAGDVRSRELSHDAQLYAAYLRAAERLLEYDVRIHRVALDHELKREYQRFLHERDREHSDANGRPDRDPREIERWALEHDLPFFDGHVHFPDLRLEYEWPDGRRDVENVEVTTRHYRGAHASAKARAGFTRYRASGGRVGGRSGRRGGRPFDPDVAGELLE
jgi:DNA-binding MarR family transcriptional regulator